MLYNRANSLTPICGINVAAFGSVMVVLVFIMMVWEVFTHHGVSVDLPRVGHAIKMPGARKEDASIVSIQRDGRIFFGNERVTSEQLPAKITEHLSKGADKKVYVNADRHARYGEVKTALDAVRSAGVENIGILVAQ